ncbi:hypothetical protein [Adlercreutzia sp. ZJ242]|uniref:hypothetical protein n=1 Tax=Adlercreutzia sp. ZJ242 TaxID=2709409 RepID=UPI0013ED2036|nr:hypothetical protein [Adlercreutzia sp. ZJ242]
MIELSEAQRKLCRTQADIFEASTRLSTSGSAVFVRRFMRSDLARRMDEGGFPFESNSLEQIIETVEASYAAGPYGSETYSANEMHWMGFFYRCWCCATGSSSKSAYAAIGARELRRLYYPYHSLDPTQAVERVMEAKRMSREQGIERGVEVLKVIRNIRVPVSRQRI